MPSEQQLLAELAALRAEMEGLRDKVTSLEREHFTLSENQFIQLGLIKKLRNEDKKDIERGSPLLDELFKEMVAIGRKQTDFATAARMVGRSKRRMIQLKTAIALDNRFVLIPSERHSQKLLIRLRETKNREISRFSVSGIG